MPSREDVAYFGAGWVILAFTVFYATPLMVKYSSPAPLPTPVLEKGAQAFLNFENSGLSLAEISHRSKTAEKILSDTKAALAELLDVPKTYDILFMHGGGSGEFSKKCTSLPHKQD